MMVSHYLTEQGETMQTFKEHNMSDEYMLSEGALAKSPTILFGLLWRTYSKIKGSTDPDSRAKYQAQMTWIIGQLSFSYIKELDEKIEQLSRDTKRLKQ